MKARVFLVGAVGFLFVMAALAQQPESRQSNSPTSNQFRMKVLEPLEGATITGNDFNVVVGIPQFPSGTAVSAKERKDALRPIYQIWLDGKSLGNMPSGQNVLNVHAAAFGPHKIVIEAKNTAGEVIDRKEIAVTTAAAATAQVSQTQTIATAPAPAAPPAPPAPVEAAPAPSAPPPQEPAAPAVPATLPRTASSYPLAAVAGLALMGAGLLLRRVG